MMYKNLIRHFNFRPVQRGLVHMYNVTMFAFKFDNNVVNVQCTFCTYIYVAIKECNNPNFSLPLRE